MSQTDIPPRSAIEGVYYDDVDEGHWKVGHNGITAIVGDHIDGPAGEMDTYVVLGPENRVIAEIPAWKVSVVYADVRLISGKS